MRSILCTIGFAGKSAEEFFRLLKDAGVRKVIDVRENRIGQLAGFAKYPDIEFFLERVGGISYGYEPLLAPSPEIRKTYRRSRDWPQYQAAFLDLMRERNIPDQMTCAHFEGVVALLCSEPGPEKCHRRLVADLLSAHWRSQGHLVEILHLTSPRLLAKPKRKKLLANP